MHSNKVLREQWYDCADLCGKVWMIMERVAGRPRVFVRAAAFVMLTLNVWRALINDEQITPAQAAAAL